MFGANNTDPVDIKTLPDGEAVNPDKLADEALHRRHNTLIECLHDERDLQAEERTQMAIDADYHDHLHWRPEDAQELIDRGQAPLVFNEGRQTVEWVCGMQKRMRMDEVILPRTKDDEQSAEIKTKVFKYVSDANLSQWHESRAFEQTVISGLGWLEEGINTDPGATLIYSGSEDWRNVYRDSRSRDFDMRDARYLFRRKRTDLDYAIALLPKSKQHLIQMADTDHGALHDDNVWYLGERLTGASDLSSNGLGRRFTDRSVYIGGSQMRDHGRRLAVDLIECWYRVPESIRVFSSGPMRGKEFNAKDPAHQQLQNDRWGMYSAVAHRMRVMIATDSAPLWDGKSPMRHQNFMLVPIWGYRRGRDGLCYGLWRGMRDINDDINKRASKALHAASSNRVISKRGAVQDVEMARQEASRPDMFLEVTNLNDIRFEKPTADMQMNLELLSLDREMLRNGGGVTDSNLGRDSQAVSGKAIGLQQDQGSLATSKLPDNLRLAKQIAGRLRLSHIEQFMTEEQVIRVTGDGQPMQWITVNQQNPDGTVMNDISSREADYIIGERDYRETYAQAAMQQMMELLGQVAGYAPQVVMNVLDLVVDSSEIKSKDEWVMRIRKLNGQRDPKKSPTPEEQAQAQKDSQDQSKVKDIQLQTLQAQLDKLKMEVSKLDTEAMLKRVESMFSALQAAQIVAMNPTVAPVGDAIAAGAGFKDQGGQDPNLIAPSGGVVPVQPQAQPQQAQAIHPAGIQPVEGNAPDVAGDPAMNPQSPASAPTGLDGVMGGMRTPTASDNTPVSPQ